MAMVPDSGGNFVASPVLAEAPSSANGGITESPPTITYHINPDANWSDGTPITSKDFDFTWRATLNTPGAFTTAGYDQIESIDTSDPKTAVLHFKTVYAAWPQLFGGVQQGLLEAAAFPTQADEPKPNLQKEMLTSIPFSGGPWILKSWSNDQAVLVPNKSYYGTVPLLDQVTMVPFSDLASEVTALLAGEVDAITPQIGDVSLKGMMGGRSDISVEGADSLLYEALWINDSKAPLDDPKVREALMYAIDRQSLVDAVVKVNNPNAEVLNCGAVAFPSTGPWCKTVQPFSQFTYDPQKSVQLLQADDYDCSNLPEPCTKNGEPLVVEFSTTSEDTRRTTGQQLLQDKLKGTGFAFQIKNYTADVLFGSIAPKGKFTMTEYARGDIDPSVTGYLSCEAIPTEANGYTGGNWNHWCNQQASDLMHQSDQVLDTQQRQTLMDQIYNLEAQDFFSLPLYVLPQVGAWNSGKLGGPVTDYIGSLLGMYANINQWYLTQS
jgi:peptide/nickel transport system substrate-binding protein